MSARKLKLEAIKAGNFGVPIQANLLGDNVLLKFNRKLHPIEVMGLKCIIDKMLDEDLSIDIDLTRKDEL